MTVHIHMQAHGPVASSAGWGPGSIEWLDAWRLALACLLGGPGGCLCLLLNCCLLLEAVHPGAPCEG